MSTDILVKHASAQNFDSNGKVNKLLLEGNVIISVSPMTPLDVPSFDPSSIQPVSNKKAKKIIEDLGLKVTDNLEIEVDRPLFSARIESDQSDSSRSGKSNLKNFRNARKLAFFLKKYALYAWANDPDNFGKGVFVIDETHDYEIDKLSKTFTKNNSIYSNGKITVHSKSIRNRLINYVDIQLSSNKPEVENLKTASFIEGYYQTLSDFTPHPHELVFIGYESVMNWIRKGALLQTDNVIQDELNSLTQSPYYYINPNIQRDTIFIVQNVAGGDIRRAIAVCVNWNENKINSGYETDPLEEDKIIPYILYTYDGILVKGNQEDNIQVIQNHDGTIASLLKI